MREFTEHIWHIHCLKRRLSSAIIICVALVFSIVRLFLLSYEGTPIVVEIAELRKLQHRCGNSYKTCTHLFSTRLKNRTTSLFWFLGLFLNIFENYHKMRATLTYSSHMFDVDYCIDIENISNDQWELLILNASCSICTHFERANTQNSQCKILLTRCCTAQSFSMCAQS